MSHPLQLPEGIDFIGDFNEYGIENVPSQEHGRGFGCVLPVQTTMCATDGHYYNVRTRMDFDRFVPFNPPSYLPPSPTLSFEDQEFWMWAAAESEREREMANLAKHSIQWGRRK